MADTRRGVQHVMHPVTPGATHTVECLCGYKRDVVATDIADAISKARADHPHPETPMKATAITT